MRSYLNYKFILIMAGVIVFSVTLYALCYFLDNKYTAPGLQAKDGLLDLSGEALLSKPVTFLIYGWEIYRGRLLTPEELPHASPDEIVFIGQYGGFEGAVKANPHGCATYRLTLNLPPEPAAYTLELPEIYSAYRLYVDGALVEQFGNPVEPPALALYRPQTGNATVSFIAREQVQIILAVSDYSHLYSGLVYPPAFGLTAAVATQLQTRLTIRAAVGAIALALGLFFWAVGFFMRKNRKLLLFGAVCLCFVGYTCYPLVKTITRGGLAWYGLENLCFCVMLLLVMLLLSDAGGGKNWSAKLCLGFGLFVCGCSVLQAALPTGNLFLLSTYSLLIGLYKWVVALYLTLTVARTAGKDPSGGTILAGILVFDCGLVMDRLLPLFEPIRFGWFLEIGGFALVLTLGIVVGQEVLRQYRDKLALESKITGIENIIAMQRGYYPLLIERIEEARRARHDLRHHLGMAQKLLLSGDNEELKQYLDRYAGEVFNLPALTFCENHIVDVIMRHFDVLAQNYQLDFSVDAQLPEKTSLEDADLGNLISNLLENALEACLYVPTEKRISITIKQIKDQVVILVENSFDGYVRTKGGKYLSRKSPNREGLGLASIKAIAAKYGGEAVFKPDPERKLFHSEVVVVARPTTTPSES